MQTITHLREEIDHLHQELHALFVRRRDLTTAIWKLKQADGLAFHSPEREAQILRDFVALGSPLERDPQTDELMTSLMRSILLEYERYLSAQFKKGSP